ncbi:hypothetical protein roselon_01691 [Roseibacterium elongatum DSM 19469]|uniref:Uncharacterized protein n=1 Tax=Roseicyclus elongatus DSM 19469 TaxID=1294273 RepID=W8RSH5_9RHOB|nr:hypothetical protein roselon_01691 [Roseibacterium elongatum DSM 19469]
MERRHRPGQASLSKARTPAQVPSGTGHARRLTSGPCCVTS